MERLMSWRTSPKFQSETGRANLSDSSDGQPLPSPFSLTPSLSSFSLYVALLSDSDYCLVTDWLPPFRSPAPMRVNPAVLRTAPPPIPLAQGWKAQYLAASSPSGPMLDLSQGVPSAPPSQSFVDSLIDVVKDPSSARYGGILGEPVLRRALRAEWEDVYDPLGRWEGKLDGQGVTADDLGVVCGANMVRSSLFCLEQSIAPPCRRPVRRWISN